jgi:hypothetical protein
MNQPKSQEAHGTDHTSADAIMVRTHHSCNALLRDCQIIAGLPSTRKLPLPSYIATGILKPPT